MGRLDVVAAPCAVGVPRARAQDRTRRSGGISRAACFMSHNVLAVVCLVPNLGRS